MDHKTIGQIKTHCAGTVLVDIPPQRACVLAGMDQHGFAVALPKMCRRNKQGFQICSKAGKSSACALRMLMLFSSSGTGRFLCMVLVHASLNPCLTCPQYSLPSNVAASTNSASPPITATVITAPLCGVSRDGRKERATQYTIIWRFERAPP